MSPEMIIPVSGKNFVTGLDLPAARPIRYP